jgi:methionine sulfoxide reductase catalytic subunit
MLTRSKRGWELPERAATPESVYLQRRQLLATAALGPVLLATGGCMPDAESAQEAADEGLAPELYPAQRNDGYSLDREVTAPEFATTYNNFYEFGSHKRIWKAAQRLELQPWTLRIAGLVEQPLELDALELIRKMPLEERLYRHRCVEAWSMAVPWAGFPLRSLVELARPLGSAKYLKMVTFEDSAVAPGQRQFWYPWPYVEALTLAEATNELAFIATGLYGKTMPKQNGAPLRLVVPWKYGFKSVKSIVLFEFTETRPVSFWEEIQAQEYGFWANVNPEVPHPRWSQATEEVLGTSERVPTQLYNGYGEFVADLYAGMEGERLFM